MAPLTWRNVDSPSFSGSNDIWKVAAFLMNSGIESARTGLKDFRDITTDEQSAALMQQIIAAGNDPNAAAAAVQGANPAFVSAAALKFANDQPGVLLDRQQTQANIGRTALLNDQTRQGMKIADYDFGRKQVENQRADEAWNMMPEAVSAMTKLRTDLASGNYTPEQSQQMQQDFISKYGRTLNITDANAVGGFLSNNLKYGADVRENNLGTLKYASDLDQFAQKADAEGVTNSALQIAKNDPDMAIRVIQGYKNIDPKVAAAAVAGVEALRPGLPKKTAAQQAIESSSTFRGITTQNGVTLPDNYQPIIMNNRGTRNLPLNSNLNAALSRVLPNLGLTTIVDSGGQVSAEDIANGVKGSRTGSTRHDHGGAADVKFRTTDGRILSWENPQDVPLLQQAIVGLKEAGLTGFGAGHDYMGATTTHVGYGTPAVWGSKGGKPYQALLDAYNGAKTTVLNTDNPGPTVDRALATEAAPKYQAAMDAVANNQPYQAPIDLGRPQIKNDDGSVSTERTFTTEIGGAWFNIPSIVNGKQLPEQEALDQFKKGTNPAVGVFQSQREAEAAAEARSAEIGRQLDAAANQQTQTAQATTQTQNDQITNALTPVVTETAPTKTTPDVAGEDNFPKVDTTQSQYVQDVQTETRKRAINNAIADLTSSTGGGFGSGVSDWAGSTWDYYFNTPSEAKANQTKRDQNNKAGDFLAANADYFRQNPAQIAVAKRDPVAYVNNFGKTPSQQAYLKTKEGDNSPGAQIGRLATPTATTTDAKTPVADPRQAAIKPPEQATAASVDLAFSQALNTAALNAATRQDQGLINSLQKGENNDELLAETVNRLTDKEKGPLKSYNNRSVTKALTDIMNATGANSAQAGQIMQMQNVAKYNTGWTPWSDEGLGSGFEIDTNAAKAIWDRFVASKTPGAAGANEGIATLMASDLTKAQTAKVKELQSQMKERETALKAALKDPNITAADAALVNQELQNLYQYTQEQINSALGSKTLDTNLRNRTGK